MRYKVGDRVRVKSLDWYNQNKNKFGCVPMGQFSFHWCNTHLCGAILTIKKVQHDYYLVEENSAYWTDEMIEGLVEEENKPIDLTVKGEEVKERIEITIPEGYEYVIESDKIIFTKKKKEYPKTYEECCKVLGLNIWSELKNTVFDTMYKRDLMNAFHQLLICRDAYWKIAGEEMGLGKPWEPEFGGEPYYCIKVFSSQHKVEKRLTNCTINCILAFPTEEMQDAFYENFKELIESCKELL